MCVPAELGGRVSLGGGPDEDAHSSSPRRGDPDGLGPVPQNNPELRRNPLAQDLHAHVRERDLTSAGSVHINVADLYQPWWMYVVQGGDVIISVTLSLDATAAGCSCMFTEHLV